MKIGFDNEKYLAEQQAAIAERLERFSNKLYLEFGGKLLFDYHASRVLPGFDPNVKIRLIEKFREQADVILCIYAGDIERRKIRADFGITYDQNALKIIDELAEHGINLAGVVITRFNGQPAAEQFKRLLKRRDIRVYTHGSTRGYPTDVDTIVSDEGYGANEYIETERPVVIVTAPGPNSGKLATCLSQLYHDHKRGFDSGYAKFETFPIWNLPLNHPVNVAYEAATADIGDYNLLDHFHLDSYNQRAVNYNRDVDAFPVLRRIIERITGNESFYKSPTDMGVNRAGFGITDDDAIRYAAGQEIIRRYFRYSCEYIMGMTENQTVERVRLLMEDLKLTDSDRRVVAPARQAAHDSESDEGGHNGVFCGAALELPNGSIVTGKNSALFHAASSLVLNSVKQLAGIPDSIHLLPETIVDSVGAFKKDVLGGKEVSLDLEETLVALAISGASNPAAQAVLGKLKNLSGCDAHLSHIPSPGDEAGLRKLGIRVTADSRFAGKELFGD
ncbi:MAG: DUF1846 domain-containing protein [Spirochaetales bacterium]|jgi:uncharacterized protein (UPF0371 family)|nr:DUF1846 domain-containing protein [Spirochaetales bacterium]